MILSQLHQGSSHVTQQILLLISATYNRPRLSHYWWPCHINLSNYTVIHKKRDSTFVIILMDFNNF